MVRAEGGVVHHADAEVVEPGAPHQEPDPLGVDQPAVPRREVPLVDQRQVRVQQNCGEGWGQVGEESI